VAAWPTLARREFLLKAHIETDLWRRGLEVSSTPAIEEAGAMGREIESRLSPGYRVLAF
jgi:hypothetical protein